MEYKLLDLQSGLLLDLWLGGIIGIRVIGNQRLMGFRLFGDVVEYIVHVKGYHSTKQSLSSQYDLLVRFEEYPLS